MKSSHMVVVLDELRRLITATQVVGALSLLAVDGSYEAYAEPVHAARPHPGSYAVAATMRRLLGAPERPTPPLGRIQDPYGFRCLPQIHGPAQDAADLLERTLAVEINAAAEDPLICPEDMSAYHHGGFCMSQPGLALDHFRLAVTQTARLSTSRLSALNEPAFTRLRPFLADGEPGSSGVMILEYAAGVALGDLSAVRALRQRDLRPDPELPVGRAFALADGALDSDHVDRPLTDDVTAAAALLDQFTDL